MLSWEYPPVLVGGLARHVYHLSEHLARQGARVTVLTQAGAEPAPGVEVRAVQPYFSWAPDFPSWAMHLNFALVEEGTRLLTAEGADVLHAHDWLVAYAARCLKHLFRLPLLATIHATEHGRMGGLHHQAQHYIHHVEWWLTYEAWRVICCSRSMQDEVARLFALPPDKVRVIPNGVSALAPAPLQRERFAAPGEQLVVHVGRLVPEKGAGVLLEAFPLVLSRHPAARLVIAGSGPWEEELRRRAVDLELGDRVHFAGRLTDGELAALYRHADVVVVPSTYEPFGIVALEAMAAGAPLVVSAVGGLEELVEHGVDGLKAPPGRPEPLAEQITRFLAEPATARRCAARAREKVARRYSWESVAAATLALYEEVAAAHRRTGWGAPPFSRYGP